MIFNSVQYAVFLPVVVVLHHLAPRRLRPPLLLLASYLFYASYNAVLLLLIIALTAVNHLFGLGIGSFRDRPAARNAMLALAVTTDLAVLAFYKYALFLLHSLGTLSGWLGAHLTLPEPSIFLPLGISFFTFEFIHYVIEVRRGGEVIRSPVRFAVFAAFFPTQIAGPIKRYQSFMPQLENPRPFDLHLIGSGLRLIIGGLFKKVVLADSLAPLVAAGFNASSHRLTPLDAWLVAMAFGMQIYLDFSGFTDIARGSARVLGFEVPENFRRPYLALNPSEFWRRWHMSLSTWFRDYLYIPLGGNRRLRFRNLFLTMLIGGLWHGASWTFVIWGGFHGVLLVGYWLYRGVVPRRDPQDPGGPLRPLTSLLGWAVTLALVTIGWVFFRATSFDQAMSIIGSLTGLRAGTAAPLMSQQVALIVAILAGVIAVEALQEWGARMVTAGRRWWPSAPGVEAVRWHLQPLGYAALVGVILVLQPVTSPPFIYFHF